MRHQKKESKFYSLFSLAVWYESKNMWLEKLEALSLSTVISLRVVQAACIIHRCSTEECIVQSLNGCIPCVVRRRLILFPPGRHTNIQSGILSAKKEKLEIQSFPFFSCALLCWWVRMGPIHRRHLQNYLIRLESYTYGSNTAALNKPLWDLHRFSAWEKPEKYTAFAKFFTLQLPHQSPHFIFSFKRIII